VLRLAKCIQPDHSAGGRLRPGETPL